MRIGVRLLVLVCLSLSLLFLGVRPAFAIVGGQPVSIGQAPYQVRVEIDAGQGTFVCGGSIRDATHVITAAHCVTNESAPHLPLPVTSVTVFYGSADPDGGTPATVRTIAVPSQFSALLNPDTSYDAALLELTNPIDLSGAGAKAIRFVSASQARDSGMALVSGFGATATDGDPSATLLRATVPLRPGQNCSGAYADYVSARHVCAGGGNATDGQNPDFCDEDGGGPLTVNGALLGIVSFGPEAGCGLRTPPSVYVYVRGSGISGFLGVPAAQAPPARPAPAAPPAPPPPRDTSPPQARVSFVHCRRAHKMSLCKIHVRTSDPGPGLVKTLSAKLTREVRSSGPSAIRACRWVRGKGRCRTRAHASRTLTRRLRPKPILGGYAISVRLRPHAYLLSALATDTSGNRAKVARKRFRVRLRVRPPRNRPPTGEGLGG